VLHPEGGSEDFMSAPTATPATRPEGRSRTSDSTGREYLNLIGGKWLPSRRRASVGNAGRLWFGSMDNAEEQPSGALYRWESPRGLSPQDRGYVITNGPAVSPDGRTLYHTDTLARTIYAFDLDDAGMLSRKRVFANIEGSGYPDGMAVDAEAAGEAVVAVVPAVLDPPGAPSGLGHGGDGIRRGTARAQGFAGRESGGPPVELSRAT